VSRQHRRNGRGRENLHAPDAPVLARAAVGRTEAGSRQGTPRASEADRRRAESGEQAFRMRLQNAVPDRAAGVRRLRAAARGAGRAVGGMSLFRKIVLTEL